MLWLLVYGMHYVCSVCMHAHIDVCVLCEVGRMAHQFLVGHHHCYASFPRGFLYGPVGHTVTNVLLPSSL